MSYYSSHNQYSGDEEMEDSAPLLSSGNGGKSSSDQDPYYRVKSELETQLNNLQDNYDRYKKLYPVVDTSSHTEFISLRKSLNRESKSVQNIVTGVKGAVDQVERHRHKFPTIRDAELGTRKQFVMRAQSQLNDIRQGYDALSVRDKMKRDGLHKRSGGGSGSSSSSGLEDHGQGHGQGHGQVVMKGMIAQQDEQLEHLGSAVERLGDMAGSINDELKEQNRMLGELDEDLDEAGNKMNTVMATLSKSLRTKDSCQIYTVVVLILVALFLFFLVLYT